MTPDASAHKQPSSESMPQSRRACVFAHYDKDEQVDEYVYWYLRELLTVSESLIFVTVSNISLSHQQRLSDMGIDLLMRENIGYDFMSYRLGVESLALSNFDELILCNDSVYGPFYPLQQLFDSMRQRPIDFWGATDSYELQYHLQSFFLVFRASAFRSSEFAAFWQAVAVISDKQKLVEAYEVGLTQTLLASGLHSDALFSSAELSISTRIRDSWLVHLNTLGRRLFDPKFWRSVINVVFRGHAIAVNSMHTEWKALLLEHKVPFLKVALIRDNPRGLRPNPVEVFSAVSQVGSYPVELIRTHQERVRSR